MSRAKAVILPILFTIAVHASATTAPNAAVVTREHQLPSVVTDMQSPIGAEIRRYYSAGPATMPWRDSISVSHVSATFDIDRQSCPVTVQEGDGHNMYRLEAGSYYKISGVSTVWGTASFSSGVTKNVTWADCIDYSLLAPYMPGDDTGGNLSRQCYRFGGGWARHYGAWTAGVSTGYRAETAHRVHDPRVRDIVSDLTVSAGGAHTIGSRYMLALDASVRIYHQDCDVDYYNPANTIMTRLLTGIGSVYNRFDNNQVNSTGHNLTGWNAVLTFAPAGHYNGISASVSLSDNTASMVLRQFNNLTLATTATRQTVASLSWHLTSWRHISMMPTLKATASFRDGKENLFGSASGTSYDRIGSRSNYSHDIMTAAVIVPVEWNPGGKFQFTATPTVAYSTDKESLTDPVRRLKVNRLTTSLDIWSTVRPGPSTHLSAGIGAAISSATPDTPVWGNLNPDEPLGHAVKSNFMMHSADKYRVNASAALSRVISGKIISLSARYVHTSYRYLGHTHSATLSLSLTF